VYDTSENDGMREIAISEDFNFKNYSRLLEISR